MEQTYIAFISFGREIRKYFFRDFDEAVRFERLFNGNWKHTNGGYEVTI